jgi:hypothetical protein
MPGWLEQPSLSMGELGYRESEFEFRKTEKITWGLETRETIKLNHWLTIGINIKYRLLVCLGFDLLLTRVEHAQAIHSGDIGER